MFKKEGKRIREVLLYTDTDLLETFSAFLLLVVDPALILETCVPWFLFFLGVVGSIIILIGVAKKNFLYREVGLLFGLASAVAVNVVEIRHGHPISLYVFQVIMLFFTWWRVSTQRANISRRGQNGKH